MFTFLMLAIAHHGDGQRAVTMALRSLDYALAARLFIGLAGTAHLGVAGLEHCTSRRGDYRHVGHR